MKTLKIILPASEIPLKSTVMKQPNGRHYVLVDELRIFSESGNKTIKAEEGTLMLSSANGDASVIETSKELVWEVEYSVLLEWLEQHVYEGKEYK